MRSTRAWRVLRNGEGDWRIDHHSNGYSINFGLETRSGTWLAPSSVVTLSIDHARFDARFTDTKRISTRLSTAAAMRRSMAKECPS